MDVLSIVSSVTFAGLLSLYILELGAAVWLLVDYNKYNARLAAYVAPIWEITGTFSVFYLVSFEAFYPKLLFLVGTVYILPIILGMVFLILRDSFLAYSEYIDDSAKEFAYSRIYGITTILALFLLITVLDSSISGYGINIAILASNYWFMLSNPFNILMFLAVFMLVIFTSGIFFNIRNIDLVLASFIAFMGLFLFTTYEYLPSLYTAIASNLYLLVPSVALLLIVLGMFIKNDKYTRFFVLPFLFISLFSFEYFAYPWLFGGSINITSYLAPSINSPYLAAIIIFGGIFLAVALGYFVYIQHLHRENAGNDDYD